MKGKNDDYFNSFCTRMWLDYCDENNDPISAPGRMDRDEYVDIMSKLNLARPKLIESNVSRNIQLGAN